jgi:hypothetical protein
MISRGMTIWASLRVVWLRLQLSPPQELMYAMKRLTDTDNAMTGSGAT